MNRGAVVSMVSSRAVEGSEPMETAVIRLRPSSRAALIGTSNCHLPSASAVVVPRLWPLANTSTPIPREAVPTKLGVVLLVRLSELLLPLSAVAMRSGMDGGGGWISNSTDCSVELPAESVAMTVKKNRLFCT